MAVDLAPLDGQIVRWTAGSSNNKELLWEGPTEYGRGVVTPDDAGDDEDVYLGSRLGQLSDDKPAELRVLLERRVATVGLEW